MGTPLMWPRLTTDQSGIVRDAAAWHCVQTASDQLGTISSHLPLNLFCCLTLMLENFLNLCGRVHCCPGYHTSFIGFN